MKPWKALLIIILMLVVFGIVFGFLENLVGGNLQGNLVVEPGSIGVHFCPVEDCERIILDEIGKSEDVICAFYDLELDTLEALLVEKKASVLVYEENALEIFPSVNSKGLMHHKFCVLDNAKVITGSTNPTENGVKFNDNNLLIIESETISKRFLSEFSQLESGSKRKVPPRYIQLNETIVQLLFCPQEECERAVIKELNKAEHSVNFMTFSFTSDAIGSAVLEAYERGVLIEGVFEARMNPEHSEYDMLLSYGLDVVKDTNSKTMHHKVFIIDNRTVITGSYNPTWSANERNDENLLIIEDERIAKMFLSEFERVWNRDSLAQMHS